MSRFSRHTRIGLVAALALAALLSIPAEGGLDKDRLKVCRAWLRAMQQYVEAGNNDSAMVALDSVLACDSANADAWYHRGIILGHLGDTAAAVSALETGVERAPLSARLKIQLARMYQTQGRWQESVDLATTVLAVRRRNPEAAYIAGLGLLHTGDSTAAADMFERALKNKDRPE